MNTRYDRLGTCGWFCRPWQILIAGHAPFHLNIALCWGCWGNLHLLTL